MYPFSPTVVVGTLSACCHFAIDLFLLFMFHAMCYYLCYVSCYVLLTHSMEHAMCNMSYAMCY